MLLQSTLRTRLSRHSSRGSEKLWYFNSGSDKIRPCAVQQFNFPVIASVQIARIHAYRIRTGRGCPVPTAILHVPVYELLRVNDFKDPTVIKARLNRICRRHPIGCFWNRPTKHFSSVTRCNHQPSLPGATTKSAAGPCRSDLVVP